MNHESPHFVLVAAKWWPLSARLAIALLRHGCRVSAVCPAHHPLTHAPGVAQWTRYAGTDSLGSVRRALHDWNADVVIPCDDGVVAQLHALHRSDPGLRPLIERSLGPEQGYAILSSRLQLMRTAEEIGILVPKTRLVAAEGDLVDWFRNFNAASVVKSNGDSGGNGVRICASLAESITAWRELKIRPGRFAAWKRLAIDRDPLALWTQQQGTEREITIQQFLPGRPANSMMACRQGQVLSIVSVVAVAAEGPTGAATVVRRIDHAQMTENARRLAERLQLTGFYGLDYIIAPESNKATLIEMNPRCTQLGHLDFPDRPCLAGVFSAALSGRSAAVPRDPIRARTIAFFPQALAAGPACRDLIEASFHDVPTGAQELVEELKLGPWPQRQWGARLYHAARPIVRPAPIIFESLKPCSDSPRLGDPAAVAISGARAIEGS